MSENKSRFLIAQDQLTVSPEEQRRRAAEQRIVRDKIWEAGQVIDKHVPEGREKSLALTKLEEALMWAGKGIFNQ